MELLGLEQCQSNLLIDTSQAGMLLFFACELARGCLIVSNCRGFEAKLVVTGCSVRAHEDDRSEKCNQPHLKNFNDHFDS